VKLPNQSGAIVRDAKITDYLLSPDHPRGRFKEAFFRSFGFARSRWEELRDALLEHAATHEVCREETTPHGLRYVIEGPLRSPDGRCPGVRSVWFVRTRQTVPEFVTAYPLKGRGA
jgi:hypothetical protein